MLIFSGQVDLDVARMNHSSGVSWYLFLVNIHYSRQYVCNFEIICLMWIELLWLMKLLELDLFVYSIFFNVSKVLERSYGHSISHVLWNSDVSMQIICTGPKVLISAQGGQAWSALSLFNSWQYCMRGCNNTNSSNFQPQIVLKHNNFILRPVTQRFPCPKSKVLAFEENGRTSCPRSHYIMHCTKMASPSFTQSVHT